MLLTLAAALQTGCKRAAAEAERLLRRQQFRGVMEVVRSWSDSGCVSKLGLLGAVGGLDVGCENERPVQCDSLGVWPEDLEGWSSRVGRGTFCRERSAI